MVLVLVLVVLVGGGQRGTTVGLPVTTCFVLVILSEELYVGHLIFRLNDCICLTVSVQE